MTNKEMTVAELIELLKKFRGDLPVRRAYDSGVMIGPIRIVAEYLDFLAQSWVSQPLTLGKGAASRSIS